MRLGGTLKGLPGGQVTVLQCWSDCRGSVGLQERAVALQQPRVESCGAVCDER